MQAIGLTDIGNYRAVNEDTYFVSTNPLGSIPNLFMVADGLGGHSAGEIASETAVEAVSEFCRNTLEEDHIILIRAAFEEANRKVQARGKERNKLFEMGTTLVSLIVFEDHYQIANVGDSRAYLYRNGVLQKLTKDHSLVQKLQEDGIISEEEAFSHEKRNLILRAVGMEPAVSVDVYTLPAQAGDILMLCSDGLSNFLRSHEMQELFAAEKNIAALSRKLIDTALANDGTDNITVVMVKNAKESEDDLC